MTPWKPAPRRLRWWVGGAELDWFRSVGEYYLDQLASAGLKKTSRVLEIGCGCGRIAGPLARFLGPKASYLGVDVRADLIDDCRGRITPADPRFRFKHVGLRHPFYNPKGRLDAARWRLSTLGRFDFVILVSVLTHLDMEETSHYLREIRTLLAPGGRAFITFFLHSPKLLSLRRPRFDSLFPYRTSDARFNRELYAFSYPERTVLDACARAGLELALPVRRGDWSATSAPDWPHQDAVILRAV